jgi:predicted TPR repeat methyltransferase
MDYDEFAEAYAADNEVNLLNGHYERPAMLSLAGDVDGRRILDVGCGAGPLSAALRDRGATMAGFDLSEAMIELPVSADHSSTTTSRPRRASSWP